MNTDSLRGTRSRAHTTRTRWGVLFAGVIAGAVLLTAGPFGALRADAAVAVLLGTAGDYAVLGATPNVTNTGPSVLTGNLGVSPANSLVGFGGAPNGTVIGAQHAADAEAGTAQEDLTTAYLQAAGMASTTVATQLGNTSPVPGAYTDDGGGLNLTGTITLDGQGSYDSIWVFQSTSDLITSGGVVSLTNGAQACNIFWQVTSSATLGSGTTLAGTVMALTSITVVSGVTVQGRLLARNGTVTLDNDVITRPATCVTGLVDDSDDDGDGGGDDGGDDSGDGEVGGVTVTAGDDEAARLAMSGMDARPGLLWAAGLLAIGFGAVALSRRLTPRGAHRAD